MKRPDPADRPLTVLQVVPALDSGGAEQTCIEIAGALTAVGSRALATGAPGRLVPAFEAAGGTFHPLPLKTKSPLGLYRNAARIAHLIEAESVDIVHARSRAPAWSALLAARRTGRPFVTTYHGIYGERSAAKRLYNSVMARGDRVIANSDFTADLIRTRYGTPTERVVVIHRGIEPDRFDPARFDDAAVMAQRRSWGVPDGAPVVLLPGRLTAWKGQETAIRALAQAGPDGRPDARLVLVGGDQGRDAYHAQLKALTAELGLAERVVFAGHSDDMARAFAASDVALSTSTKPEAFGRVVVEAQAMGLPVIASELGPVAETVVAPPHSEEAARTGWLVPPADPTALAAAIDEVLALPPEAKHTLAARARAHVLGSFTVSRMTEATLAVYRQLVSAGTR